MADTTLVTSTNAKASAAPLAGTDVLRVIRSTTSYKATLADVATYVAGAMGALAVVVGSIELGHATDTTISRVSAGRIAVEGSNVLMASDLGTTVQAYDADLASWAAVTRAAGFDTFVATPSSANLAALLTDETGSGALVFGTSPAIASPTLSGTVALGTSTLSGTPTFTGDVTLSSSGPNLYLFESDATTNNKYWRMLAQGEDLYFGAVNDAQNSAGYWAVISRTGVTIDSIALSATALSLSGVTSVTGATLSSPTISGVIGGGVLSLGAGTNKIYVYDSSAVATLGFGNDLSGGSYELSIFAGSNSDGLGRISFGRRRSDTGTYTERGYMQTSDGSFVWGAPTGGAKGAGTINAVGVYDDNTLLTDLVLDLAVAGTFDRVKYAKHPVANLVQPWWFDADQYAEFWKANRHLPGMISWLDEAQRPSTGEVATRLTAVAETHAVLLANDNDRIKALQARVAELEAKLAA